MRTNFEMKLNVEMFPMKHWTNLKGLQIEFSFPKIILRPLQPLMMARSKQIDRKEKKK